MLPVKAEPDSLFSLLENSSLKVTRESVDREMEEEMRLSITNIGGPDFFFESMSEEQSPESEWVCVEEKAGVQLLHNGKTGEMCLSGHMMNGKTRVEDAHRHVLQQMEPASVSGVEEK